MSFELPQHHPSITDHQGGTVLIDRTDHHSVGPHGLSHTDGVTLGTEIVYQLLDILLWVSHWNNHKTFGLSKLILKMANENLVEIITSFMVWKSEC